MSIVHAAPAPVSPEWHTEEPTPLDVLVPPADPDPCPCEDHPPRFVIRPEAGGWSVVDRAEDAAPVVAWHLAWRDAADDATDRNAEDWPPVTVGGRPWYSAAPPCEHFDVPVRVPTL